MSGRVIDRATQQPIIGANVTVMGTTFGAATDGEGRFKIAGLEESVYKLRTSFLGYLPVVTTDVRVVRNKTTSLSIELAEDYIRSEEITVTVDPFLVDKQSPVSNYTYSREEINRSPGAAGDIFRAMETLPGVSSSGGEFSAFSVRGASPRDNIVLVDNIPVDRVTHFDGGSEEQEAEGGRFSVFAPKVIDEAKFQAGGFPARYGGKNASFVDLKVKEGNRENFTLNGSFDLIGWEINYDGPSYVNDNTSVLVSARHQNFKGILEMTGQKDLGDPSFTDIIVKTTTDLGPSHRLSFLGIVAPEKFDRTLDHVYESEDDAQTELQRLREEKYVAGLNWRFLTGVSSFLHTTAYFKARTSSFTLGRAYTDAPGGGTLPKDLASSREVFFFDGKESEFGLKSSFTQTFGRNLTFITGIELASTGLDYHRTQNGRDTLYTYDQNDYRPDQNSFVVIRRPEDVNLQFNKSRMSYAAFVDNSIAIGNSLVINPGVRYERSEFNKKNYVSPRLSASYAFTPVTRLSFATGVYYQPPDPSLLADDARNTSLLDERAVHAILGVSHYMSGDVRLTVEAYYKNLDNLVVWPDRSSQVRTNQGEGWAAGVDVSLLRRFVDNWYGQVSYSYAQAKRNDHDGNGWYNTDFNQPHIFSILAGYELNSEWSFSAKWKYATGRPADEYIIHENVFNDPAFVRYSKEITRNNGRRLDDFHTLNVRVDYRKQFGRIALVSFIDVLNLYNRLNVNEERFFEKTGAIDKKGFRITPTIGVKLEL
jgi:hypothetical protein